MYISNQYWDGLIGGSDDSLTLAEHLAGKGRQEITAEEFLSDFGLDKLGGNFRKPDLPLAYTSPEGWEVPVYSAIDLISSLAALLLECKVNGSVGLDELGQDAAPVRLTASPEAHELINRALADFASSPLDYDLSEMCPEEELLEMAEACEALRKELYEGQP